MKADEKAKAGRMAKGGRRGLKENNLKFIFFLCLWILWRWTQHLPSTSKYYKYFFVNRIYESFQSLQTRLTNLPTKGDLWSFCESPEESHHTPANTSCFSWRVTSLTRLACRIIPGPCHTRFFPSIGPRWRGDHELSAMTLWIVYVGTSIWVDLGKKANLTDIWHAVRERKPRRITIEKDKEDRGTKERPAFVFMFVHI